MKRFNLFATLSLVALVSLSQAWAIDLFARFEGGAAATTVGEASEEGRANWITLESFDMGVENTVDIRSTSSGGGTGKASFKEVTLTKKVDSASAPLMLSCATGQHYETVTIEFTRTVESQAPVFFRMIMKHVLVQSVSSSAGKGDDTIEETVVLKHGAHEITTFKQDERGAMSQSGQYQWSIIMNTPTLNVN